MNFSLSNVQTNLKQGSSFLLPFLWTEEGKKRGRYAVSHSTTMRLDPNGSLYPQITTTPTNYPSDAHVKKCKNSTVIFSIMLRWRMLANALSNLGVGGFGPNRVRPFGFSAAGAPAGTLALVSFLHNHIKKIHNELHRNI